VDTTCSVPLVRILLYIGLEDGLRQRVNVEIENFRASLQEVMREQFASQRSIQCNHHPHCTCHQYCQMKVSLNNQAFSLMVSLVVYRRRTNTTRCKLHI
jgi:hypothetical protein